MTLVLLLKKRGTPVGPPPQTGIAKTGTAVYPQA